MRDVHIRNPLGSVSEREKKNLSLINCERKELKRNKVFDPIFSYLHHSQGSIRTCDSPWVEKIVSLPTEDQQWADFPRVPQIPVTRQWLSRLCRRKIGKWSKQRLIFFFITKKQMKWPFHNKQLGILYQLSGTSSVFSFGHSVLLSYFKSESLWISEQNQATYLNPDLSKWGKMPSLKAPFLSSPCCLTYLLFLFSSSYYRMYVNSLIRFCKTHLPQNFQV